MEGRANDDIKVGLNSHAKVLNELINNQKVIVKKVDELEGKLVIAKEKSKEEKPKEEKTKEEKKEEKKKEGE